METNDDKRGQLNVRMKVILRTILGDSLRFYEYDIDALLAMSNAELERTLLDYLERYARDQRYHGYKKPTDGKTQ